MPGTFMHHLAALVRGRTNLFFMVEGLRSVVSCLGFRV